MEIVIQSRFWMMTVDQANTQGQVGIAMLYILFLIGIGINMNVNMSLIPG